jgi:hypothetical protein
MLTKLLKQPDVKYHEYLLSYSGIPSRWRANMVNPTAKFLQIFFPTTPCTFPLEIENPAGVIDPLGAPRGPIFHAIHRQTTVTSYKLGRWDCLSSIFTVQNPIMLDTRFLYSNLNIDM